MSYLYDSDILIDYLGGDPDTKQLVDPLLSSDGYVSVISYIEVLQGILAGPDPVAMETALNGFLVDVPLFSVSPAIARRCARLRFDLAQQGKRVRQRGLDLVVAATALEHGLTLVTRNKADYQDIRGLSLY
jgi:predicted nucleic acid-binding protein